MNKDVFLTDEGCTDGTPKIAKQVVRYAPNQIIRGDGNFFWLEVCVSVGVR